MADNPASWKVLLEKRKQLLGSKKTLDIVTAALRDRLEQANKSQASVKFELDEIEEALMSLGWMPEKENA